MASVSNLDRGTDVAGAPFDGYIRVSRVGDRSGESYISPSTQEKAICDWAQRRGERLELNPPEGDASTPGLRQVLRGGSMCGGAGD